MINSTFAESAIEDRIRAIAYSLWLEEGQPEGRAEAHWFKAMELANAEAAPVAKKAAPAKKAAAKPKAKATTVAARKAAPRKRG